MAKPKAVKKPPRAPRAKPTQPSKSKLAAKPKPKSKPAAKPKPKSKPVAKPKPKPRPAPKPAARPAPALARPAAPAPTSPATAPSAPPQRDELPAPQDVPRLTRYGERFGPHKIDTRMLPQPLPIGSSALALFDPGSPRSWRELARPIQAGQPRVMLSIGRSDTGGERPAALVVYVGHAQIAQWTVANHRGHEPPRAADQLPRCASTSGWLAVVDAGGGPPGALPVPPEPAGAATIELPLPDGRRALAVPCGEGEYAAYWATDAADRAVCLVVDLEAFTRKEWKAKPARPA